MAPSCLLFLHLFHLRPLSVAWLRFISAGFGSGLFFGHLVLGCQLESKSDITTTDQKLQLKPTSEENHMPYINVYFRAYLDSSK